MKLMKDSVNLKEVGAILAKAIERGHETLLETEGLALLKAMGLDAPMFKCVHSARDIQDMSDAEFKKISSSDKIVVKVVSHDILHKSDVGGVKILPNIQSEVVAAIEDMERKFKRNNVEGYTINEFIRYDASLGHELLFGIRWTDDFGPVMTFGPGGIYTEFLSHSFIPGKDVTILHPEFANEQRIKKAVDKIALSSLIFGGLRGQKGYTTYPVIKDAIDRFLLVAKEFMPRFISEFEVNPLVLTDRGPIALDILLKLPKPEELAKKEGQVSLAKERPVEKIGRLLQPKTAAIVGVSEKLNPGHVILNNLIRDGFKKENIYVIKPDTGKIEGCACVSDVSSLPVSVDLFVLAISAAQVPETITEIIKHKKAESILVIPGGLEEKEGTQAIISKMNEAIVASRKTPWKGPVINGGNCLGIRSIPGKYDTMFIPEYKLPVPKGPVSPIALISQSGAFAVSRASKLSSLNLKYSISVGNQMDLTIADYLNYLKDDKEIRIFAVYVEGFKPLDGKKFLKAAEEIVSSGRHVILYRAGRTPAGAKASASHTAAIAGDFPVTRELMQNIGVVVTDNFADFDDLVKLFYYLLDKKPRGHKLGAISNAGCECVAIADNLGKFTLSQFSGKTAEELNTVFKKCKISEIVDVHNPIDLTPMAGDMGYEETIRAVLKDEAVDVGIVGIVPLTPTLNNLPASSHHGEDFTRPDATPQRLLKLRDEIQKPWVAVIDSGSLYDPFAEKLDQYKIPVFRTADRALKLFNIFCGRFC